MDEKKNLQSTLIGVLKSMRANQLKETLMIVYPNIDWIYVLQKMHNNEGRLSKKNVATIAAKVIMKNEQIDNIPSNISHLRLIAVSKSIKNWKVHRMRQKEKVIVDSETVFSYIKETLRIKQTKIDVNLIDDSGKLWILVECRKKNKNPQFYYFMIYRDQKYIFTNSANVPNIITDVIAKSLGYNDSKPCNLSGKSLVSLLRLLKCKENKAHNNACMRNNIDFDVGVCKFKNEYVDFTFSKEKAEYIDDIIGKDTPSLQYLAIGTQNATFKGLVDDFNHSFDTKIEFQSQSVFDMLKKMMKKEIISIPVPHYMQKIMTAGKNIITLKKVSKS